ncbi:MAG: CcmD family protein [Deltaproteobacteria bacterium]|nr:MAG: CcmD family protein [Deltaproteobacteria bacterium]
MKHTRKTMGTFRWPGLLAALLCLVAAGLAGPAWGQAAADPGSGASGPHAAEATPPSKAGGGTDLAAEGKGTTTRPPEAGAPPTQAATEETPPARKAPEGFTRVSGPAPAQEALKAPPLVIVSYLFIWLGTFLYLFLLWRRQRRIAAEIESLKARLAHLES